MLPFFLFLATTTYSIAPQEPISVTYTEKDIPMLLERHFGANKGVLETMEAVSFCESGGKQFEDGKVLISKLGTDDRGIFQINYPTWKKDIESMDIDVHTVEGNIIFAKHILKVQGLQAWKPSEKCWRPLLSKI